MKIETLKNYLGLPTQTPDLSLALDRIHSDHRSVLSAVKLLSESVQSNAAGNLDMAVVHEERHKDILRNMRELKREVTTSDNRHFAAFELALRPVLRAIDLVVEKINSLDADVHTLRAEIYADKTAVSTIQNTKLNAIAFQIDTLVTLLAKDLIKHPDGVTVAPPKRTRGGKQPGAGRKKGSKPRPPEVQYADLSNRLQRCRAPKAREKYMARLVALRAKMGMAPMSDRALGKEVK